MNYNSLHTSLDTPYITVTYKVDVQYKLPKDVKLRQYHADGFNTSKPGSWFIKYGKMEYYDEEGNLKEVKGSLDDGQIIGETICDVDFKWHEDYSEEAYGVKQKTDDPDEPLCVGCGATYLNCRYDCSEGRKRFRASEEYKRLQAPEPAPVQAPKTRKVRSDKGKPRKPKV